MRTGNDMSGDEIAHPGSCVTASIDCGPDTADISANQGGDESASDLDFFDEGDIGGFHHRVTGFNEANVAFGL